MHGLMRGKRAKPSNLLYNNITHLSVVSSRQRSKDWLRCEKRINVEKYSWVLLWTIF